MIPRNRATFPTKTVRQFQIAGRVKAALMSVRKVYLQPNMSNPSQHTFNTFYVTNVDTSRFFLDRKTELSTLLLENS